MAKRITDYGLIEYCIYKHPIVLKSHLARGWLRNLGAQPN